MNSLLESLGPSQENVPIKNPELIFNASSSKRTDKICHFELVSELAQFFIRVSMVTKKVIDHNYGSKFRQAFPFPFFSFTFINISQLRQKYNLFLKIYG